MEFTLWGILPFVILGGALIILFFRMGGQLFLPKFKGKAEVQRVVYEESKDNLKVLGTPVNNKGLYYGIVRLGKVNKVSKKPYSTVKKIKYEDSETLAKKWRREVVNGNLYLFEVSNDIVETLGFGRKVYLIREEHIKSSSDAYIIDASLGLERWGSKFWFSKDAVAQLDVENIVWKDNYQNVLGLVEEFPEKVIKFEPQTAHDTTVIKEQFEGMKDLKQGRRSRF